MPNPVLRDFVCANQRALAFFEGVTPDVNSGHETFLMPRLG